MKSNLFQRITSGILAAVLLLSNFPVLSLATEDSGLCPHHETHQDCGYREAVEERECTHVCEDACYVIQENCTHVHGDCGYAAAVAEVPCDHVHGDCGYCEDQEAVACDHICGDDCTEACMHQCADGSCAYSEGADGSDCTHVCGDGSCAYSAGTEEIPCTHLCSEETGCVTVQPSCAHIHDAACGYGEAVEAQPCTYSCVECKETAEVSEPVSMTYQVTERTSPDSGLPENTELYQAYVEQLLFDTQMAAFGLSGRDSLNAVEQDLYDALKEKITATALTGGDTVYILSDTGSLKTCWTNEELNVDSLTQEAVQTAFEVQFDLDALITALLTDCPFECYWYDKTETGGVEFTCSFSMEGYNDGTQDIWTAATVNNITFSFAVSQDYQGSQYSVTTDVETVAKVRENAQAVADAGKKMTDREAMEYFRSYICSAVSYDREAADDATRPYGDPWQLIHVFDGDDSTNVVCEGYAKAFQYLCDLAELTCESVSGTMTSDGEAEGHMWNVVTLDAGRYLVDVTNCDAGTVGADTLLFLVTAPYESGTYTFDCDGTEVIYTCDDLNLAEGEDQEAPHTHAIDETTGQCACGLYGTCGENLIWEYDTVSSTLNISGAGDMPDYTYTGVPWYGFRSSVQKVVLDERIITIGNNAFYGFTNLKEIAIPSGVTKIGIAAFWECGSLTEITVPDQVKEIGYAAFSGCSGLTDLVLPENITDIGERAFEGCTKLASINIPSGLTYIRAYAFYACRALTRITVPKNVCCIEKLAFGYCTGLAAIDFRGEPPTIYDTAFTGVTATARYSKDMPAWSSYQKDYGGTITWVAYGLCDEGHTEVTYPGSAPTCTEPGSTPLIYCDVCLEILQADSLIPATGHTEVIDEAVAATCTEPGLTEGKHCSVCGEVLEAQTEIPASHSEVIDDAVAATCTETGLTEGKHCSVCGEIMTAQEIVPATGHTEVVDEALAPTCTETGLTEGKHCSVCAEVLVAQEEIPTAHEYEAVYTDPTYDADGFTTYTCSACGDSYTETDPGTMKSAAASISDVKYGTLAEAFAAAKAGDTIRVLMTYTIPSGTSETWNLTDMTMEFSSASIGIVVNGSLKIMGGTFRGGFLRGEEKSQITIDAGTFQMDGGMRTNYGQITINGGTFTFSGDSQLVTQARFIGSNKFSIVIINNGVFYFKDNGAFYDYGLSTIKGGTFYLERQKQASIVAGYSDYRDSLTVTGGTFYINGPVGFQADYYSQFYIRGGTFLAASDEIQIIKNEGAALGIYGGTFSQDMTSYLEAGYCCTKTDEGYVVAAHRYQVEKAEQDYLKNEATCFNPPEYYLSCACGKAGTATFFSGEPLGHSFTDYVSNNNASCTANATQTALCDRGCGITDEREIPDSALGHTYQNGVCTVCGEVNKCGDNLNWTLENGVLTISGSGSMYDFTLDTPAPWYEDRSGIAELHIANGVTIIGSYAFYGCTGLTEVTIPESVISIGEFAFGGCSGLKDVTIPDSVTNVSGSAFSGCSGMGTVVIPGGMDKIDDDSFAGCEGLSELWFRGDFPEISANAFQGVTATAWYPADNATWTADKLQNYGGNITWKPYCLGEHTPATDEAVAPSCTETGLTEGSHCSVCGEILVAQEVIPSGHNVEDGVCTVCGLYGTCGDQTVWHFEENTGTLTISGTGLIDVRGYSAPWKNWIQKITEIVIEEGITEIPTNAFSDHTELVTISIPSSVIAIGFNPLSQCINLRSIHVDEANSCYISSNGILFDAEMNVLIKYPAQISLKSYEVPYGVTVLDCRAFEGCVNLTEIELPDTLISIQTGAFEGCTAITEIVIPDNVAEFGAYVFNNCTSLTKISLPEEMDILGECTFQNCYNLKEVVMPEKVGYLCYGQFINCFKLNAVALPKNIDTVFWRMFENCSSLESIYIPACVNFVDEQAFFNCGKLAEVFFVGDVPRIHEQAFVGVNTIGWYPSGNLTWTADKLQNYGGSITWEEYCPNGHTEVINKGFAPTCTETGLTEGKHCSLCGEVLTAQEEIPATGHSFAENVCTVCGTLGITLVKQPENAYALEGEYAVVTLEAEGEELTYKWYYRNAGGSGFTSTTAFTGNTYKVAMNADRSGRQLYCVITDKYGNSIATDIVTISLKTPLAIVQQPVSVKVMEGANAVVSLRAEGDGLTYQWYFRNADDSEFSLTNTFKGSSYTAKMDQTRDGRQIYCVISDKYGDKIQSDTVTISMKKLVSITRQPVSVAVKAGETAKISLEAEGDGLTYAWYFRNAGASKFSLTTSFTGNTYSVSMNEARNGRQIYCVVTDAYGNTEVSDIVTISLMTTVKILQQPVSVKVPEGVNAIVSVQAEGDGLTYQWYFKNAGQSQFSLTNTFKGSSYSAQMNETRDGRQVYCVITDQYGNTVQSDTATVSMIYPAVITRQPVSVTVAAGEKATVSLDAEGEGLTYAWYYKNANSSKFYLTTSFTGNNYTITMNESRSGRQVYCVVTDQYGNSVASDTVTLSMKTPLRIAAQPVSVKVKDGANAVVSLRAEGDGLTYRWYWAAPNSEKFQLTNTFKGSSYTVQMNENRNGRRVYCVITDQYGDSVTTDTVTISMADPVKIVKMEEVAIADEGEVLTVTVEALGDGLTYAWYFKNPGGSKFYLTTSFTGNTYTVKMTPERDGRQIYCVVTDQYGYSVTSQTLTLQMRK